MDEPRKGKTRLPFSVAEDILLRQLVAQLGEDWSAVASAIGTRNARQCRDRWRGYLRPDLINEKWTRDEDELLISQYNIVGPKWHLIAHSVIGRSEIAIKQRWQLLMKLARSRGDCDVVSLAAHLEYTRNQQKEQPARMRYPAIEMEPISEVTCINDELRTFLNTLSLNTLHRPPITGR